MLSAILKLCPLESGNNRRSRWKHWEGVEGEGSEGGDRRKRDLIMVGGGRGT